MIEWLDVLNLDEQNIASFGTFNFERFCKVVDSCEINVLHVISTIIVFNLASHPIEAFDLYSLSILDRP
jgi:hypothetical protein